jgi:vacuolar-type H+-ATPase subunit D/Vma8
MNASRVPATRSGLLRYSRRLDQVRRGAALLKRKRQSLVDELLARAKTAVTSREAIDAQATRAWRAAWLALASTGSDGLRPLAWPTRELEVTMTAVERWGVSAMELAEVPPLVRGLAARGIATAPGDAEAVNAAHEMEVLLEQLLKTAPQEHAMRRLGQALSRTTRLVNTLEQRVAVDLVSHLNRIRSTLAEREREEQLRIKRLVVKHRRQKETAGQVPGGTSPR